MLAQIIESTVLHSTIPDVQILLLSFFDHVLMEQKREAKNKIKKPIKGGNITFNRFFIFWET